jgi:hypothetical protein
MPPLIRKLSFDSRSQGRCALAAAFLFFVLYTAPHRVHHFFEQGPIAPADHDDHARSGNSGGTQRHDHDGQSPQPQRPDCAVQLVAQSTHFASPPLIEFPFSTFACARTELLEVAWAAPFDPSPFSQRAPPLA